MNKFDVLKVRVAFGVDSTDWDYREWFKAPFGAFHVAFSQKDDGYAYFVLNRGTSFFGFTFDPSLPKHCGTWSTQGIDAELALICFKALYLLGCEDELDGYQERFGLSVTWTEKSLWMFEFCQNHPVELWPEAWQKTLAAEVKS